MLSWKLTSFTRYKYKTRLTLLLKSQLKHVILINPLFLIIHLSDLCNIHYAQIKEEKYVKANLSPDLNSLSLTPRKEQLYRKQVKAYQDFMDKGNQRRHAITCRYSVSKWGTWLVCVPRRVLGFGYLLLSEQFLIPLPCAMVKAVVINLASATPKPGGTGTPERDTSVPVPGVVNSDHVTTQVLKPFEASPRLLLERGGRLLNTDPRGR